MALMVGSLPLYLLVDNTRTPKDLDLLCRPAELQVFVENYKPAKIVVHGPNHISLQDCTEPPGLVKLPIVDVEIAWPGSTGEAILGPDTSTNGLMVLPTVGTLYWLKMSHRYKKNTPHFEKTREDILLLRRHLEDTGNVEEWSNPPWYKARYDETMFYNHPNLQPGQNKEAFFSGDGVKYYYPHDDIHLIVARIHGSLVPAYTLYLKEGEEVACDREKFDALPLETRLRGVSEEAMVLALERSQIPRRMDESFNKDTLPEWSYRYALQKVCTSITSGWFREFSWEHYDEVLSNYPRDYVEKFWESQFKQAPSWEAVNETGWQ